MLLWAADFVEGGWLGEDDGFNGFGWWSESCMLQSPTGGSDVGVT